MLRPGCPGIAGWIVHASSTNGPSGGQLMAMLGGLHMISLLSRTCWRELRSGVGVGHERARVAMRIITYFQVMLMPRVLRP